MESKFLLFFVFAVSIGTIAASRCVTCKSTDNLNCLNSADRILPTTCAKNVTEGSCYMRILDGHVDRGCAFELTDKERSECNGDNCETCVAAYGLAGEFTPCNTGRFPRHRIECHHCNDTKEICGVAPYDTAFVCAKHTSDNKCYVRRKGDLVQRGCTSDFPGCAKPGACFTCDGSGCNNIEVTADNVPEYSSSIKIATNFILVALLATILKVIL